MRLLRQASKNKTKTSLEVFDKNPKIVSWDNKKKELALCVSDVPHESPDNKTRYDYWLLLSAADLSAMLASLTK